MNRRRRLGLVLVFVGVVLCLLPFVTGSATLGQCLETGLFYDLFGIDPMQYRATVDLQTLDMYWFDGCNGHRSSLVPAIVGVVSIAAGIVTNRTGSE